MFGGGRGREQRPDVRYGLLIGLCQARQTGLGLVAISRTVVLMVVSTQLALRMFVPVVVCVFRTGCGLLSQGHGGQMTVEALPVFQP